MLKKYLKELYNAKNEFEKKFTDLKVAIHSVDKIGVNVEDIYKQLDNVGIELYKLKNMIDDKIKEHI